MIRNAIILDDRVNYRPSPQPRAVHRTAVGAIEIYGSDGTFRDEVFIAADGRRTAERRFCDGSQDLSAPQPRGDYDSRCSCCFLNFAHSAACHRRSIDNHERAAARVRANVPADPARTVQVANRPAQGSRSNP